MWIAPDGEEIKTYTIITTEANKQLKPIHDRMPVILPRKAEDVWLDPTIEDPARLLPLLKLYPPEEMEAYPVSRWVNGSGHDGPECIEPLRELHGDG